MDCGQGHYGGAPGAGRGTTEEVMDSGSRGGQGHYGGSYELRLLAVDGNRTAKIFSVFYV